jgi:hypothetical protein
MFLIAIERELGKQRLQEEEDGNLNTRKQKWGLRVRDIRNLEEQKTFDGRRIRREKKWRSRAAMLDATDGV